AVAAVVGAEALERGRALRILLARVPARLTALAVAQADVAGVAVGTVRLAAIVVALAVGLQQAHARGRDALLARDRDGGILRVATREVLAVGEAVAVS